MKTAKNRRVGKWVLAASLVFACVLTTCGDTFWDFETSYRAAIPTVAEKSMSSEGVEFDSFAFSANAANLEALVGFDSWCFSILGPFSLIRFNSFEPSGISIMIH